MTWPRYDGPGDLAAIEAVPLADRGLPESTYELLRQAGSRFADRPALTLLPSGEAWEHPETWTYGDLLARVHRIANVLTDLGLTRRDAVALLAPNSGDVFAATLAAQAVGIAAPVNPGLAPHQVRELLETSGARLVIAADPGLDVGRPVLSLAELGSRADAADPVRLHAEPPRGTDFAGYFHTGGSTGTPKIAVHTQAGEVGMAWTLAASTGDDDLVLLAALPLFHVNALLVTGLAPLFKGQHVVWAGPLGYRDPALYPVFWRIVERYRIGAMSAVPTVYAVLAQVPLDADISSLTFPIVGAAPLPAAVRRQWRERTGVDLVEGYGLTEGTCASARGFPGVSRPGTVRQRMPYQEVKAVRIDGDGRTDLPPGETGVLVIRGPNVFPGYLRDGKPDPAGKVVDGWLDTGDLGSVDAEGFVRLAGRAKDLIIRGGHNIDPATIEEALLAHPAVSGAAAIGRPDRHSGEVPVVYVTLHAPTPSSELLAWAAARVPERAAVPKDVHIVPEIPLTAVGKQYKPALRQDTLRRVAEAEVAALGLDAEVTVELDRDEPVVVVHATPSATLESTLDSYAFRWRHTGRSPDS
ncbi:AMP-binding protein [Amycolatopsis sp. NBC_00438]|uniref:AMP-binding protein n=1 Tax=Amycolatopsis sp. NBC_00438 TaxID=2903558 RepID=UPI002E22B004